DAGILAGTQDHLRSPGGEPGEKRAGGLVRAVLAPQDVEADQLGPARHATEALSRQAQLVLVEMESGGGEPARQGGLVHEVGSDQGESSPGADEGTAGRRAAAASPRSNSSSKWDRCASASKHSSSRSPRTRPISGSLRTRSRKSPSPCAAARAW